MFNERVITIMQESFIKILIPGITYTIPLTLVSFTFGLILAITAALIQVSNVRILTPIVKFYVWVIRGTPLLVQIFIIFYGLPSVGIVLNALPAAIIAFSLNVGAYASETLRAAILSVPIGQIEAGHSLGMNYFQVLRRITLPQAFKVSVPPLFNSFIGLVKDTSLAANITVTEMFMVTQRIAAKTFEPLALYVEVAFIYLLFCTVLSKVQNMAEKRLKLEQG